MFGGKGKKTIDMTLSHDGREWIAWNQQVRLSAVTLDELDKKVESALRAEVDRAGALDVFMAFDNEVIPKWIRPYMNHYFNRVLELSV